MKKAILLTTIISAFFLAGCTINNQKTIQESDQVKDSQTIETITQEDPDQESDQVKNSQTTETITQEDPEKTDNEFIIPEVGIKIIFPDEYTITKNNEKNRRGSFVSYDFSYKTSLPAFYEIQFFNEESIKQFAANCGVETPCFFGDYPDLERYKGQKNAFDKGEDYEKYELKKINNRQYFVNFLFDPNGSSYEYTTFIDDIKIDIWISVENESQQALSDELFKKLVIQEL